MRKTKKANAVEGHFIIDQLTPDRSLSEPVYKQLVRRLRELIASGEIGEEQSLPAERNLAKHLNISRTTVRRIYDELRQSQELISKGREGAVLLSAPKLNPTLGKLKGFTAEMHECGIEPSTRLLERAIVQDRTVASMLARPSTAEFLKLVRLRLGDGLPLSRETAWYDLTIAPELASWSAEGSAYEFIQRHCGVRLAEAEQSVEAVLASADECQAFGFTKPAPCLLFKRKTKATTGQIVEYAEGVFRGDAYIYRLTLK